MTGPCRSSPCGGRALILLALQLTVAASLAWQDCGLLADVRGIELLAYSHTPDPIQVGQSYSILRTFRSLLGEPIRSLTEEFWSFNRSAVDSTRWSSYFHNGPFNRCGQEDYQIGCPLAPHSNFSFEDHHPAARGHGIHGEHRSVEHYFVNGHFAGCAVVVYQYSNTSARPSRGPAAGPVALV
mmetsp:Transcript_50412/g.155901  ORF Transcript_50412/g.155901 Transcript_50412/m.155901 type:complete len:183 (+) Transcript_50412:47-595(+)